MVDPGEGPRGPAPSPPPTLFLDQTEAQRTEKFFLETTPPSPLFKGLDCQPPPPPPLSQGLDLALPQILYPCTHYTI